MKEPVRVYRPIEKTILFLCIEKDVVESWQNESDVQLDMGCKIVNSSEPSTFCLMVKPNGEILNIEDGKASERYASVHTNMSAHTCSIQVSIIIC